MVGIPRRAVAPTVRLGRWTAGAMVVCTLVHAAGAVFHLTAAPVLAVATLLAGLACLHCCPSLCRGPSRRTWVQVILGSGAMLAMHLTMLISMAGPGRTATAHGHAAMADVRPAGSWDVTAVAGLLLPVVCLALAWRASGHLAGPHTQDQPVSEGSLASG